MHTVTNRNKVLQDHIDAEHSSSAIAGYFKEVIYGGIDGIVTTFAIVAGFSGAAFGNSETTQLTFAVVLLFGLANLFADAASMGLGNFLAIRSEKDLYDAARAKEAYEIAENTDMEYEETVTLLIQKGFSEADATTLADIYKKNTEYWTDFMMNHELEMPDTRGDTPAVSGLITFFSFLMFGAIPLAPFMVLSSADTVLVFEMSSAGTFIALVLLGLLKWRVIGTGLWKSLFEVVVVGGTAALIAFFVGTWFAI